MSGGDCVLKLVEESQEVGKVKKEAESLATSLNWLRHSCLSLQVQEVGMEISVSQRLDWDQQPCSRRPGSDSLLSFWSCFPSPSSWPGGEAGQQVWALASIVSGGPVADLRAAVPLTRASLSLHPILASFL